MMSGICSLCNTKTNKFLKKNKDEVKEDDKVKEVEVKVEDKKEDDNKEDGVKQMINHIEHKIKKVKGIKKKIE